MAIVLPRRRFIQGVAALFAAPALVKASSLMPVKSWGETPTLVLGRNVGVYRPVWLAGEGKPVFNMGLDMNAVIQTMPDAWLTRRESAILAEVERALESDTQKALRDLAGMRAAWRGLPDGV